MGESVAGDAAESSENANDMRPLAFCSEQDGGLCADEEGADACLTHIWRGSFQRAETCQAGAAQRSNQVTV